MKKAIFLLSAIVISASCFLSPEKIINISGNWSGTHTPFLNYTFQLDMTLSQRDTVVSGTWTSSYGIGKRGSVNSGTISGHTFTAQLGDFAFIKGTVSDAGNQIVGSWMDAYTWASSTFSLQKR
jgi:hypothetical protein